MEDVLRRWLRSQLLEEGPDEVLHQIVSVFEDVAVDLGYVQRMDGSWFKVDVRRSGGAYGQPLRIVEPRSQ